MLNLLKLDGFHHDKSRTTRLEQDQRREKVIAVMEKLKTRHTNVQIFDPIDLICDDKFCSAYKNGISIYQDDDHVNYNLSSPMYLQFNKLLANLEFVYTKS